MPAPQCAAGWTLLSFNNNSAHTFKISNFLSRGEEF